MGSSALQGLSCVADIDSGARCWVLSASIGPHSKLAVLFGFSTVFAETLLQGMWQRADCFSDRLAVWPLLIMVSAYACAPEQQMPFFVHCLDYSTAFSIVLCAEWSHVAPLVMFDLLSHVDKNCLPLQVGPFVQSTASRGRHCSP